MLETSNTLQYSLLYNIVFREVAYSIIAYSTFFWVPCSTVQGEVEKISCEAIQYVVYL